MGRGGACLPYRQGPRCWQSPEPTERQQRQHSSARSWEMPRESVFVVGNIGTAVYIQSIGDEGGFCNSGGDQQLSAGDHRPVPHRQVSAILNITEDHLNRHHTMEEYIRVKELIAKNQGPERCLRSELRGSGPA